MVDYIFHGKWLWLSSFLAIGIPCPCKNCIPKRVENEHFYSQIEDANVSIREWEFLSVLNFISVALIVAIFLCFLPTLYSN